MYARYMNVNIPRGFPPASLNLIVKSQIVAKRPDKEYGETALSFRDIYIITVNIMKIQMKMIWEKY